MRSVHSPGLSRREAIADVAIVGGSSAAYGVASWFHVPVGWIIAAVAIILAVYWRFSLRQRDQTWRDYGIRVDNLVQAAAPVGAFTFLAAAAMLVVAGVLGNLAAETSWMVLLPLYPLWGIAQQFAFQALFHRALLRLLPGSAVPWLVTSLAFAAVHGADVRVVGLTLIAGM